MKICQPHWQKLRDAIKDRGLGHLVAKDGKQATDNVVTELQGGDADYDPLMSCNFMIWNRALRLGGLYLMGTNEKGEEYCPLCEALAHMQPPQGMTKEQQERSWIDGPADAALEACRERGLVGFEALIIINDLASMVMRIEQLQAHPKYTEAQSAVQRAKQAMAEGASDIHQREMRERFDAMDRGRPVPKHGSGP